MTGGKIRIRMEAYDHIALDASAKEIVDHAKRTNAKVAGPIPLPTRIERYTVLRSPFIDKKSREQFEIRTHKRLIYISEPTSQTVDALSSLNMPAGVDIRIKACGPRSRLARDTGDAASVREELFLAHDLQPFSTLTAGEARARAGQTAPVLPRAS